MWALRRLPLLPSVRLGCKVRSLCRSCDASHQALDQAFDQAFDTRAEESFLREALIRANSGNDSSTYAPHRPVSAVLTEEPRARAHSGHLRGSQGVGGGEANLVECAVNEATLAAHALKESGDNAQGLNQLINPQVGAQNQNTSNYISSNEGEWAQVLQWFKESKKMGVSSSSAASNPLLTASESRGESH